MVIVGIDPGKSGAIVAVDPRGKILCQSVMPLLGKEINPAEVAHILHMMLCDGGHVYIEHSQAMPKNGAVSMFNYGVGFGMLIGICSALSFPYVLVKPREWQKTMHRGADQSADPKDRSAQVAYRIFPKANFKASERCKKDHDGMVDAALIAYWGALQSGLSTPALGQHSLG